MQIAQPTFMCTQTDAHPSNNAGTCMCRYTYVTDIHKSSHEVAIFLAAIKCACFKTIHDVACKLINMYKPHYK